MTEFYKSIPEGIREKLQEYVEKFAIISRRPLTEREWFIDMFTFSETPEGDEFWYEHERNETFPIWSEEQNRFINP